MFTVLTVSKRSSQMDQCCLKVPFFASTWGGINCWHNFITFPSLKLSKMEASSTTAQMENGKMFGKHFPRAEGLAFSQELWLIK